MKNPAKEIVRLHELPEPTECMYIYVRWRQLNGVVGNSRPYHQNWQMDVYDPILQKVVTCLPTHAPNNNGTAVAGQITYGFTEFGASYYFAYRPGRITDANTGQVITPADTLRAHLSKWPGGGPRVDSFDIPTDMAMKAAGFGKVSTPVKDTNRPEVIEIKVWPESDPKTRLATKVTRRRLDPSAWDTIEQGIHPKSGKLIENKLNKQKKEKQKQKLKEGMETNPEWKFIHEESLDLKPKELIISDLKWKYLVRTAHRGKNIMMTGPAGCGKTMAAKFLVKALNRPEFYFNLGATQDPRGTLVGNTHFEEGTGTLFRESEFVKAIQTPGAIILLDELSRAHPEAHNILMTVLDEKQRYLRLDEANVDHNVDGTSRIIEVADGVTFIATANIGAEYTATRTLDRAIVDRFIIVEMDMMNQKQEMDYLMLIFPELPKPAAKSISEIANSTRINVQSDNPKLSTSISTRLTVELASLICDGFSLEEAAEVAVYPFFDQEGGPDSERTFVKQIVQKYLIQEKKDFMATGDTTATSDDFPF
jgi:MoxR-like ATPase